MEQPVLTYAGDQNVGEPVVVIVPNGHAHAVHFYIESGASSDVGEGAVAVVAIKPRRGAALLVAGPIHPVNQKNVLPAVAVVVEESTTRTQSLGQELSAEGSTVVLELDSGTRGYVDKTKPR